MKRVAYNTREGKRTSVSLTDKQNDVINRLCLKYKITKQEFINQALDVFYIDNKSELVRDYIITCLLDVIFDCGGNI